MKEKLTFGLNSEIPNNVDVAWGARLIYPNQLVSDRQSMIGGNTKEGKLLLEWLTREEGVIRHALDVASALASARIITPTSHNTVILYEDDYLIIKGNPNMSGGYLYICAYFKTNPRPSERKTKKKRTTKQKVK